MIFAATPVAPRQTLGALADYGMSATTGFVPAADPLITAPDWFAAWDDAAQELAALIRMRRVRQAIRALPPIDVGRLATPPEQERVFLALSVLTKARVWGDVEPDFHSPAKLAGPICRLAAVLGREPFVSHASMTLQNWRRVEHGGPVSADKAALRLGLPDGSDETWFFSATLGVEILGAPLIAASADAVRHADAGDLAGLMRALSRLAEGLPTLIVALERMREWCDPPVFFYRMRPFLAAWPEPGAVYEGVSPDPVVLAGGSAGQSSLTQTFNAVLGLRHEGRAAVFLCEMRNYRPILHRAFVQDLAAASQVRHHGIRAMTSRGSPLTRPSNSATSSGAGISNPASITSSSPRARWPASGPGGRPLPICCERPVLARRKVRWAGPVRHDRAA
ncbi:MAG: hypothetical protein NTZ14_00845 [Hyphomicrobiales bacterium]|nr:hypothetical protein [Hyphomicrobiales bacterium]